MFYKDKACGTRGGEMNKKSQLQILMGGGCVCIYNSLRLADDIVM